MSSTYSSQRGKPAASPLGAGLSDEARKAMNGAFDALSDWRNDLSTITDKNSSVVFDKMGAAAKAMGWPGDFVDMTRQQMQTASKMQLQMMDQLMDVWEQQMKSPGSPIQMPKMGGMGGFPGMFPGAFAGMGGAAQSFPGFPRLRHEQHGRPTRCSSGCRPPRCGRRAGSRAWQPGWTPCSPAAWVAGPRQRQALRRRCRRAGA